MATINDFLKEWYSADDYVIAHTSGSTGIPKQIKLLKKDMVVSAEATNRFFGINSDSVLISPLSTDYIAGKMMVVRAEIAGCRLIEIPVSNRIELPCAVDLLPVVPSQIPSILENCCSGKMIRNLLIGGAPLSDKLAEAVKSRGINAWLGYGMTETCSHVALRKVGEESIFTAMPGVEFRTDARDCLVILSDKYSWGSLVTNDVVRLIDSRRFEWLGRFDNVINSGGIKIHIESLEREISLLIPELSAFYLVGIPDEKWGTALAMVAVNPPVDIMEKLKATLPDKKKLPKKVFVVNNLPVTANGGKIRRIVPDSINRIY